MMPAAHSILRVAAFALALAAIAPPATAQPTDREAPIETRPGRDRVETGSTISPDDSSGETYEVPASPDEPGDRRHARTGGSTTSGRPLSGEVRSSQSDPHPDAPGTASSPSPGDDSAATDGTDGTPDLQQLVSSPPALHGSTRTDRIASIMPWILILRREIHRRPELGFHEERTARIVPDALEAMGYQVRRRVGGTGVVATMRGARPGRTVAYRADMDALPIREETGLPFASQVRRAQGESATRGDDSRPGVMHACGHDVHTAVMLGAARVLADEMKTGAGNVIFVAQPAEELGKGAQAMLDDGVFPGPRPDSILALHIFPHLATGSLGWVEGPATANSDNVRILIRGDGGHGAFPHQTIDPVVIGAQVVVALQVLVGREVDAQESAVITVGAFHAGSRANIIPDSAELKVTVRTIKDSVRKQVLEKIERTVRGICQAAGAPSPVLTRGENPVRAGINDRELSRRLRPVMESVVGVDHVLNVPPAMGNEDFFRFGSIAPTFMFTLGVGDPEILAKKGPEGIASIHSARFVADENAIPVGIEAAAALILSELEAAPGAASPPSQSAR